MISREWLTRFLTTHLTRAREVPDHPVIPLAEQMSGELMDKWLEAEIAFWLAKSQRRGLTPQQKMLRIQVSRFYEQRLTAFRMSSRVRDDLTEERET